MEYKIIKTQRVLSATGMSLAPYAINPYRGCEFGCLYCYSQANKNIKRDEFFKTVGVKTNAADVLKKELSIKAPRRVLLGSTTECFQYAEKQYRLTEKILELLDKERIPVTILTKSHLIVAYLPLIAANPGNKIYFTFNTCGDELIRLLENKTPDVARRLKTIKAVIAARIPLRVHIGPFIPYLCDFEEILACLPAGIQEVNVELYHHSMGNFAGIMQKVEEKYGKKMKEKISAVYASSNSYGEFAEKLGKKIEAIKTIRIVYIVPGFTEYYSGKIDYQESS